MKIKEFELSEEIMEIRDELSCKKLKREQLSFYEDMFLSFVNDLLRANMPMPEKLPENVCKALDYYEQRVAGIEALKETAREYKEQKLRAIEVPKEMKQEEMVLCDAHLNLWATRSGFESVQHFIGALNTPSSFTAHAWPPTKQIRKVVEELEPLLQCGTFLFLRS